MKRIKLSLSAFVIRLLHWEYWPTNLIYGPVGWYWLWLGIKARSFYFMNAANPGIHTGGFVMESKKDVYALLPERLYPRTLYVTKKEEFPAVLEQVALKEISFPCIVKPDIGMQGLGVKKISDRQELASYHQHMPLPYLIQSYVAYPNEAGIFYHRLPNEKRGKISGVVLKEFATITGNGIDTIETLVHQNRRYSLYLDPIAHELGAKIHWIPPNGETIQLLHYGNHARGSKFVDGTHQVNPALQNLLDEICTQIPGFYFGRLDIKYNSLEELSAGKNFSIIELNGSGSSPTHIYDPSHSIVFAWKEIMKHWRLIYQIASYNHIHKQIPYLRFAEGVREVRASGRVKKILNAQNW
jgi:hypothetical protein